MSTVCEDLLCRGKDFNTSGRCLGSIHSKHHCLEHEKRCIPLYKNYKKLHDKMLQVCDAVDPQDAGSIIKAHALCSKTYDARMLHRTLAYMPEFYDYKHDFQFIILEENMKRC